MKLFYFNKYDSRCISSKNGLNMAYVAAPAVMAGLPLLAVVLALLV